MSLPTPKRIQTGNQRQNIITAGDENLDFLDIIYQVLKLLIIGTAKTLPPFNRKVPYY